MKSTGIIRRIDDLGRIVIPKEIRRAAKVSEGNPMEIFVNDGNEVVLRKYVEQKETLTLQELIKVAQETMKRFDDGDEADAMEFDFEPLRTVLKEVRNENSKD